MKTAFTLLTIICLAILTGCSKGPDAVAVSPEEQVAKLLTGDGNKYWHLKAVFQNDVLQTLTAAQLQYTKTFTLTPGETLKGNFTDNDLKGTFKILNASTLRLDFYSAAGVPLRIEYDIVSITDGKLDISYIANNIKIEEVYYAY